MNNLVQRCFTGILFVAVVLGCILWNEYSFAVFFTLISVLGVLEFHKLVKTKYEVDIHWNFPAIGAVLLFLCLYLTAVFPFAIYGLGIYLLFVISVFIFELFRKKEDPILNWAFFALGQLFIALPFAMLNFIAFEQGEMRANYYDGTFLLAFFVIVWVYDTGAYCTGMLWGKHRLFERISPKKSWEGAVGGFLFALLAACLFFYFENEYSKGGSALSLPEWFGFATIIVIFATLGDLSESLFKRTIGVKDSGKMLPGHGGILDRFDSVLFASTAIALYLFVVHIF
ncbi:MAG: phosphatidate cytidylyltransferase [Prevotellaceae bacterium]|jgi:phosphatidate cytidylyltransferase|nr:phosphatidate cytidylyltransferase [Prevotellaceae bacterium]